MKSRARVGLAFTLALASAASMSATARADVGPREQAEASCAAGDEATRALRYADAVAAYRRAVAADASAPCGDRARARAEDLEAHAEGSFAPLVVLETARADPAKTRDPRAIEALATAASSFPPGPVRAEAYVTVAEAYRGPLHDADRAIDAYERAARDPSGERPTRALALTELCVMLRDRGALDRAYAEVARDPGLAPPATMAVRRALRHRAFVRSATIVLAAMSALLVAALVRLAVRARDLRDVPGAIVRPFHVALALYIGGAAALLVRARGEGDPEPFLWLGIGVLGVGALARAVPLAFGVRSRAARGAWALACVVGLFATALLAVALVDATFLDGIEGLGL